MKSLYVCAIFAVSLLATCAAEGYSTQFDDFSMEKLVEDVDALRTFVNCFIDKGDCSPESGAFKNDVGDLVETACAKCNDVQKHMAKVFLDGIKEKLPDENQTFKNKYDPENKYFALLEEAISKY